MSETAVDRILAALKASSLSQKGLAEKLEVSPSDLNRWLKGKRDLRDTRLPAIAEALEVSLDLLVTGPEVEVQGRRLELLVEWKFRAAPEDGGQDGAAA